MERRNYYEAFLFIALFSTSTFAQKSTLPVKVLKTFDKNYSNSADVVWEVKSKGDYKIKFDLEGKKNIVEIDENGKWKKTTAHISFDQLPIEIQASVNEQKKNYEITDVKVITNDDKATFYKVDLGDENKTIKLDINEKGKIVKSETKKLTASKDKVD
ncbi:MAG: PepSY-like domain-containing protein [Crocinitomicaceae bacterium]